MYTSTRSDILFKTSEAIIRGIAPDGGLFIKEINKVFSKEELLKLSKLSYCDLAYEVMKEYIDFDNLKAIINKSYKDTFDTKEIVNIKKINNDLAFLELYHGKTLAFKDVALSILPNLLSESKKIINDQSKSIILTATSGDTGSSALCGFSQSDSKMIVLYPTLGVSKIQEKQMLSFNSQNQRAIAIEGNFDDAQNLVKRAFNDKRNSNMNLSSANSINIGRLVPQIVYYFYAYFKVQESFEEIDFVVPTGNFGNILAGYIAKKMGLPIGKLICASNSNNVLTDFFKEKVYNKNREFIKTISPSMDILVSSNLERLLYYLTNSKEEVKNFMNELNTKGSYEAKNLKLDDFYSDFATEDETKKAINEVYTKYNYLIDPHTAVAYSVYEKYIQTHSDRKVIIASTAHPYKFPLAVCEALNIKVNDEFEGVEKLNIKTGVEIPKVIESLHNNYSKTVWSKDQAYEKLCELIEELHND